MKKKEIRVMAASWRLKDEKRQTEKQKDKHRG